MSSSSLSAAVDRPQLPPVPAACNWDTFCESGAKSPMTMNLLMMSWIAAFFPKARYQALLCLVGSDGYRALRRSLGSGFPQHTILVTSVDILSVEDSLSSSLTHPVHFGRIVRSENSASRQRQHTRPTSTHTADHLKVYSNMSGIPTWWSSLCLKLCSPRSVDFSGWDNVSTLPPRFLADFPITSIDLAPFADVTVVSERFMYGCTELASISFNGLENVKTIGGGFITFCTGLQSVDFSSLTNVTVVSEYFMYGCTGLGSISFNGLENVQTIGGYFM